MMLALAIAVGWSLFQVGLGVATFVDGLATHVSPDDSGVYGALSWTVAHRVVTLDRLLYGLVEFAVALGVAVWVSRRTSR